MDDGEASGQRGGRPRNAHPGEQGSGSPPGEQRQGEQRQGNPPREPDLTEHPLGEVLAQMSATEPGPAAGSAAAISAAMAAALVAKTAQLSHRHLPDAGAVAGPARELRDQALDLARADAAGVRAMITGQDPPGDPSAIPRRIGGLASQVGDLAADVHQHGKVSLRADAEAAMNLARAAAETITAILTSNAQWQGHAETGGEP